MEEVHERIHHRLAESTDIPCAMVRRLIRDLPGVHDLVSHRRLRGVSGPLGPTSPTHRLSASPGAPGPHDFAARKPPFVRAKDCTQVARVHRIPRSTSGDDWPNAPLHRGGTDGYTH